MVKLLGIPTTLGCNKPGCDQAPRYIRDGNLLKAFESSKLICKDLGDIYVDNTPESITNVSNAKNLLSIKDVSEKTFLTLVQETSTEDKVLSIGGDHSMAIGSVFSSTEKFGEIGLIWIDAHADSNSPVYSPTGNIHGMPLSTVMGDSLYKEFNHVPVKKENVVLVGIKDVDDAEWDYLKRNNISYYTVDDIIEKGIGEIWNEIDKKIGHLPIHVSMDIDGLDWDIAPGTGIINNGGINYREIKYLSKKISSKNLIALDLAEVNPLNDIDNKTQNLSVELICDFFGGRWTNYERYLNKDNIKELEI